MRVVKLTKHHSQMDRLQVAAKMRTTASLEQERRDEAIARRMQVNNN